MGCSKIMPRATDSSIAKAALVEVSTAMRKKSEKLRIADIALAAGVSVATASNVLAHRKQYASEAGQRVLRIAKDMGYQAKSSAHLRKSIRFIIYKKHGLVIMDTPFFSELIGGIEQACRQQKYELLISYVDAIHDSHYEKHLRALLEDASMPLLLLATEMDEHDLAPFLDAKVPLLILDSLFRSLSADIVVMNNHDAGCQAARYLLANGHLHMGFIGSSISFNNMLDRLTGFSETLEEQGIPLRPEDRFLIEPTMEGGYRDMMALLASRNTPLPTAFFAANDIMAIGAARAMKNAGLRLPQDASIIGMDDMPFCQIVNPPLTTLAVPKSAIGQTAVSRLIEMANHPDGATRKTLIDVTLIQRESVCLLNAKARALEA